MDALDKFLDSPPSQVGKDVYDAFLDGPTPPSTLEDTARSAASGFARAIPQTIDYPAAALASVADKVSGDKRSFGTLFNENMGQGANSVATKILGKEYQPKTEAGKIAKNSAMFLGALPLGGEASFAEGVLPSVGRTAAAGAVSQVGSQVGSGIGKAVGGDTGEQVGSTIGGLAGGIAGYKTPEILRKVVVEGPGGNIASSIKAGFQQGAEPLKGSNEFRALASQSYQKADQLGGVLSPKVTNGFIDDAVKTLVPQTDAGKIVAGNSEATQLAERIQNLKDQPLSLQAAQEVDEHLGDVMDSLVDPRTGQLTKQGYKVSQLQATLRNSIEAAPESEVAGGKAGFDALKEGRQNWAIQARLNDIERIVARAEMMDNPATGIKTGFRTLANNPVKMRGYPPEVQNMIRKSAESGILEDALKVGGSRLWTMIGSHFGGAGAAAGFFGSALSRSGAERIKLGQAENIAAKLSGQTRPTLGVKIGAAAAKALGRAPNPMAKIKP